MDKRLLLLLIVIAIVALFPLQIHAQIADTETASDPGLFKFRGYTGGMMIHSGYLRSNTFSLYDTDGNSLGNMQIKGMPFGIGGVIRFHFGTEKNQIRVGTEGYTSTIRYSPANSYEKIGWGGILVDYRYKGKSCLSPFVGTTIGGGGVKNHTYLEEIENDYVIEEYASFRKYSFFCVTPFIGMEIAVSKKMLLAVKADYLVNVSNRQDDFAEGVRFYVGMVFYRAQ